MAQDPDKFDPRIAEGLANLHMKPEDVQGIINRANREAPRNAGTNPWPPRAPMLKLNH